MNGRRNVESMQGVDATCETTAWDAHVIACAGFYRFRGGGPTGGGWIVPHLFGLSLDAMSSDDGLRAYRDVHGAHLAFRRDHVTPRFEPLHTAWLARKLDHQRSTPGHAARTWRTS